MDCAPVKPACVTRHVGAARRHTCSRVTSCLARVCKMQDPREHDKKETDVESSRSARCDPARPRRRRCSSSPVASPAVTTSSRRAAKRAPRRAADDEAELDAKPNAAPRSTDARSTSCSRSTVDDQDRQRHREADVGRARRRDRSATSSRASATSDLAALGAKGSIPVRLDRDKARRRRCSSSRRKYDKARDRRVPRSRGAHDPRRRARRRASTSGPRCRASPPPRARARRAIELVVGRRARARHQGGPRHRRHLARARSLRRRSSRSPIGSQLQPQARRVARSTAPCCKPGEEWSFNGTVGERSQSDGYKIAHVITAGEMVDGLAGGTCQISTTLFGASFFAGLDIVKTTNHSRPSAYTPLGFDATVVWPDTDLVLKNPYDFPVAIHYRVANGEAHVEILGKKRPYDEDRVRARGPRGDAVLAPRSASTRRCPRARRCSIRPASTATSSKRFRRFYKGKKMVREQKWTVQLQAGHRVRAPRHEHRSGRADAEGEGDPSRSRRRSRERVQRTSKIVLTQ